MAVGVMGERPGGQAPWRQRRWLRLASRAGAAGPAVPALPRRRGRQERGGDVRGEVGGVRRRRPFNKRAGGVAPRDVATVRADAARTRGTFASPSSGAEPPMLVAEPLEPRVKLFSVNAGVVGRESPVGFDVRPVAIVLPNGTSSISVDDQERGGRGIGSLRTLNSDFAPCRASCRAFGV